MGGICNKKMKPAVSKIFSIRRAALGDAVSVQISEKDANKFLEASSIVEESYFLEEKFDLMMRNFLDIEKTLAVKTIRISFMMLRAEDFSEDKIEINRFVTNFLSSARAYLDQKQTHISKIVGDNSDLSTEIRKYSSESYDQSFSYRLMEALRNYSQHRDLPIRGLTYHNRWVERKDLPDEMESNVSIEISLIRIKEDHSFKAAVRAELDGRGNYFDIKHCIREYVELLSGDHSRSRDKISTIFSEAVYFLNEIGSIYTRTAQSDDITGLALVAEDECGGYDILRYYPSSSLGLIKKIRRDWISLHKLSSRVISTRARHLQLN